MVPSRFSILSIFVVLLLSPGLAFSLPIKESFVHCLSQYSEFVVPASD
ncbi:hypothetical protein OIU77_015606, partial [Salix suchowensis]